VEELDPDRTSIDRAVDEMIRLSDEIVMHRMAIAVIALKRHQLAVVLRNALGPTVAAKRLGISRQTLWQIVNPERSAEIKRRSKTSSTRSARVE
jgi:hypothetical protein